ncbi:MAG: hypothetical protein ACRC11_11325 [Xenococcaceae cyanobacterium]
MASNHKKKSLGNNPLLVSDLPKSIFSKTEVDETAEINDCDTEVSEASAKPDNTIESRINNIDSRKEQKSEFLGDREKERLNLRLPIDLNDWLDDLVKKGKRNHGRKIPKEVLMQAALEFFQRLPIEWENIRDIEDLRSTLNNIESRINIIDS